MVIVLYSQDSTSEHAFGDYVAGSICKELPEAVKFAVVHSLFGSTSATIASARR
jgi:hypothetical protein